MVQETAERSLAPENEKPSRIVDHPYSAPPNEPWGRCAWPDCGMAEAAHVTATAPYEPTGRRVTRPEI